MHRFSIKSARLARHAQHAVLEVLKITLGIDGKELYGRWAPYQSVARVL